MLRGLSVVALWVAILTAGLFMVCHMLPLIIGSRPAISLKSGVPLCAVGISYICLILTLRRTPGQLLVGMLIGSAFVLWGWEQFLRDRAVISCVDDCVVFLFVVDLSIVIRQNFRECAGERRLRKARLPVRKTIASLDIRE